MSTPASRLPAHPSLEQLRKQARERLEALRALEPAATLADAQYALARSYGFESWPKLVHHVDAVRSSRRLEEFEHMARDILAGYHGDTEALQRLIAHFGVSYDTAQWRERVRSRVNDARDGAPGDPTLADVELMLARMYGFENWAALAQGLAQPPDALPDSRLGMSSAPPFYRIDWKSRTIEPRPPLSDRDWDVVFDVMKEHRLTGISAAAMTDSAMRRLTRLDFVTRVDVGGAGQLSDDGLLHLGAMPQLEELDVSGWHSPLTDRGLGVLRHLPKLRRFQMCWPQRISDTGVANLAGCDDLESVDLLGTPTGDGAIRALTGKRRLRRFKTGKLVTDAGLPLLQRFPMFATWQGGEMEYSLMSADAGPTHLLIDGSFTKKGLSGLAGLAGLFGLSFFWHVTALRGDDLTPLADLPNLGFLGCQDALCDDDAMRHIAAMPRLRMLMGQGTVASDEGFAALSRSQTIEYIWGRECPNLGGRGFAALAAMPALRGLAVSCKRVDDAALSALPRFPALRALMPMDVSDDGFRHVGRCEQIEALWCMYCRETGDAATAHIDSLAKLETYYAGKTRITDKSLEILGRMRSLETLEFWETSGITDAGVAALATLPRLRAISISGAPAVTRRGVGVFPSRVRVTYAS